MFSLRLGLGLELGLRFMDDDYHEFYVILQLRIILNSSWEDMLHSKCTKMYLNVPYCTLMYPSLLRNAMRDPLYSCKMKYLPHCQCYISRIWNSPLSRPSPTNTRVSLLPLITPLFHFRKHFTSSHFRDQFTLDDESEWAWM